LLPLPPLPPLRIDGCAGQPQERDEARALRQVEMTRAPR
jgi:hypothetical protein